jgi:outer membrane immunogenic protein
MRLEKPSLAIKVLIGAFLALFVAGVINGAMAADKGGPKKAAPAQSIFDDGLNPVVANKTNWTGFWIGVVGSRDMQSTEIGGLVTFNSSDFGYGIAAGGDYQFPNTNIVAGVMVDYMKHNTGTPLSAMDGSWSAAARLGFVIGQTTLLYGLAGYTVEDVSGPISALNLDKGFTAGAGIESFVTQHLTLKAEYRWVDEGTAGAGAFESNTQSLRFGVNYRF